jgi:hypothetical protein
MSYTKNQRKLHKRQTKRKNKNKNNPKFVSKHTSEQHTTNNQSISNDMILCMKDYLNMFFPNVLSSIIETYTQFFGVIVDSNVIIEVKPREIAVYQNEIYILDYDFNIHVYDFESYQLLRKFNIKSHHFNAKHSISIMCVTAKCIYLNCGYCSCCSLSYVLIRKSFGKIIRSIDGDVGRHMRHKLHKDKMYVHAYDPIYEVSIECSPMYIRYFNNFEKCVQTNFHEENRDFDCDDTYVFYINEYGLNRYELITKTKQNIDLHLQQNDEDNHNKNKLDLKSDFWPELLPYFESIFLVENTIMMRSHDEIYVFDKNTFEHIHTNKLNYNYLKSNDAQSRIFMHIFKNNTNKLFMQNDAGYIHIYDLY